MAMGFDARLLTGIGVVAAVVEAGSFVRAGRALGLTQSGVSRAVSRLELALGIRLFDRTSRMVQLTEEGRRFYEQAAPLLTGIEEAAIQAAGAADEPRGRLRVNIDPFFSRLIPATSLARFLAKFPKLELELAVRTEMGDLVAEGFDIAVRMGEPAPSALIGRRLLETRVLTVASPAYLKRRGSPRHPRDLASLPHECIHYRDPANGRLFAWIFLRKGKTLPVSPPGRLVVNDAGTLLAMCLAGWGIAQVLQLGVGDLLATGRLVDLFTEWNEERFPLYALHPSHRFPPAKLRAFLDFVVEVAAHL